MSNNFPVPSDLIIKYPGGKPVALTNGSLDVVDMTREDSSAVTATWSRAVNSVVF